MSCFTTGGPSKEHGTNKPPPTRRIWERSKGDSSPHVLPTTQNPPPWNPSWLSNACATRKDSESEWLARDNLETNSITIKPETASHVAEQVSWVPLPSCSPPGCPFPVKSLALSACVSPRTIHFQVLDKSPLSGPGRGTPSCNRSDSTWLLGEIKIRKYSFLLLLLSPSLCLAHSLLSCFSFIFGFPKSYLERKFTRSQSGKKDFIDPTSRVRRIYSWAICFKTFRVLLLSYFLYIIFNLFEKS